MTRAPAPSHYPETADEQIDSAVLRLVDLLARQTARELAADAPDITEMPDAPPTHQDD